jgi:hypothetical protein
MRNIKMLITLLITFVLYPNIYSQVTSYKINGQMSDFSQDILGNSNIMILSRVGQSIAGTSGNTTLKVKNGIASVADNLLRLKKINKEPEDEHAVIKEFRLYQNYPNPFNPSTIIKFDIPVNSFVTLKVYDILGNEIETLINEEKMTGSHEVQFDAGGLSSGIYFYTITAGNFRSSKKIILLK